MSYVCVCVSKVLPAFVHDVCMCFECVSYMLYVCHMFVYVLHVCILVCVAYVLYVRVCVSYDVVHVFVSYVCARCLCVLFVYVFSEVVVCVSYVFVCVHMLF